MLTHKEFASPHSTSDADANGRPASLPASQQPAQQQGHYPPATTMATSTHDVDVPTVLSPQDPAGPSRLYEFYQYLPEVHPTFLHLPSTDSNHPRLLHPGFLPEAPPNRPSRTSDPHKSSFPPLLFPACSHELKRRHSVGTIPNSKRAKLSIGPSEHEVIDLTASVEPSGSSAEPSGCHSANGVVDLTSREEVQNDQASKRLLLHLSLDIDTLRKSIHENKQEIGHLRAERTYLEETVKRKVDSLQNECRKASRMTTDSETLKFDHKSLEQLVRSMQNALARCAEREGALKNEQAQMAAMRAEIHHLRTRVAEFEEMSVRHSKNADRDAGKAVAAQEIVDRLAQRIVELEQRGATTAAELTQLRKDCDALKDAGSEEAVKSQTPAEHVPCIDEALRLQIERSMLEMAELRADFDQLKMTNTELKTLVALQEKDYAAVKTERDDLRHKVERVDQEISALKANNDILNRKMEELRADLTLAAHDNSPRSRCISPRELKFEKPSKSMSPPGSSSQHTLSPLPQPSESEDGLTPWTAIIRREYPGSVNALSSAAKHRFEEALTRFLTSSLGPEKAAQCHLPSARATRTGTLRMIPAIPGHLEEEFLDWFYEVVDHGLLTMTPKQWKEVVDGDEPLPVGCRELKVEVPRKPAAKGRRQKARSRRASTTSKKKKGNNNSSKRKTRRAVPSLVPAHKDDSRDDAGHRSSRSATPDGYSTVTDTSPLIKPMVFVEVDLDDISDTDSENGVGC
ncbi:uncharacterized protein SPPG_01375 [Spizellomyces punctatus DAOM BR117]|uniref:Uncharacterized protein n=1 Tax=Spizellomyces punctatus (strain DAOM BR117) TaxID=645134 RepID=A0A0L0HRC3_SPIPD|nr:uncharacterized protein SPPG_01375 [Spizellomyces punctatus DAOM BR117]KND03926.1 hypothetical protein SPPG_01375 [Spizellomyces punctatus DAOM BR117]|eukprot:XP_016611965.1 hypothetical protein SPPG_01375 [Spizellomyces punctatus DAOM BR117]